MMHHCENVYRPTNTKIQQNQQITKFNGSFFQRPLIQQTLSTNNASIRHVFRSVCQQASDNLNIKYVQGFPCTMKLLNLKNMHADTIKIHRWHLRVDIKKYLKRKYQKPSYLIPLQAFESLRQVQASQKQADSQHSLFKTQILYIFKPFYCLNNLKYLLDCSPNAIQKKDWPILSRSIISCCLSHGGLDNFIMTSSNIYLEDSFDQFTINYTSFVGLNLVNYKETQSSAQTPEFFQIYPHISGSILDRGLMPTKNNAKTNKYSKIRSALVNILCLMLKRDIYFQIKNNKTDQINRKIAQEEVKDLSKKFDQLLSKQIKQKKYNSFVKTFCLNENNSKNKDYVISNDEAAIISDRRDKLKKCLNKVLVKQQQQIGWQQIIGLFCQQTNINFDKVLHQLFVQFHNYVWGKQTDKQFYIDRGISGFQLYIPIKFNGVKYTLINKNWYNIFLQADFNFLIEPFCHKLMKQLIDKFQQKQSQDIRTNKVYVTISSYLQKGELISNSKDNTFNVNSDAFKQKKVMAEGDKDSHK